MQMFSFQMNTLHKGIFHLLLRLTLIVPAFRAELFAGESNLGERWVGGDIVGKAQVHRIVSRPEEEHCLCGRGHLLLDGGAVVHHGEEVVGALPAGEEVPHVGHHGPQNNSGVVFLLPLSLSQGERVPELPETTGISTEFGSGPFAADPVF